MGCSKSRVFYTYADLLEATRVYGTSTKTVRAMLDQGLSADGNEHVDTRDIKCMFNDESSNNRCHIPIMCAIRTFKPDIVELLLQRGARVNIEWISPDGQLHRPLQWAMETTSMLMFQRILDCLTVADITGWSVPPLIHVCTAALDRNYDAVYGPPWSLMVDRLIKKGVNVNERGMSPFSALNLSCRVRCSRTVQMLLDVGADVNNVANQTVTPLRYTLVWANVKLVKELLMRGAYVYPTDITVASSAPVAKPALLQERLT